MDLRQLRYFVGIVQAGSLSRAADQLHVAQSALSRHLATLERELDRQLVVRGPKGIVLTEAGRILYGHAEAILRHVESAKQGAMSARNVPAGRVSIGFPPTLAPILSSELFARVRAMHPQILLHVSDGDSWLLRERLINGRLDMAVLFESQAERGFAIEPLLREELFYVTAQPADTSPIRIADAAQRPLLLPSPNSSSWQVVQEAFSKRGLTVTWIGEIDAVSTYRHAIASGLANGILPKSALYDADWETRLNCRRFADAILTRPIALCFSEVAERNPAIDAVALTLKSLVRELVESGTWQGVSLIEPAPPTAPAEELSEIGL